MPCRGAGLPDKGGHPVQAAGQLQPDAVAVGIADLKGAEAALSAPTTSSATVSPIPRICAGVDRPPARPLGAVQGVAIDQRAGFSGLDHEAAELR